MTSAFLEKGALGAIRGLGQQAKTIGSNLDQASGDAAEITGKVKRLIPKPKTAAIAGGAAVGTGIVGTGAAVGAGSYIGTKKGTRAAMNKSAFGVEHVEKVAYLPMPRIRAVRVPAKHLRKPTAADRLANTPRRYPVTQGEPGKHRVGKAYTPGTITQHQEQANLHSRKRQSGHRQVALGSALASSGVALHSARPSIVHHVDDALGAKEAMQWSRVVRRGATGAVVGGAGLAAVGAGRAVYHGHKQNQSVKAAQIARRQRNASIGKADRKKEAGEAFLATGSGVAGRGAIRARGEARFQTQAAAAHRATADRAYRHGANLMDRHARQPGTKDSLPRTTPTMRRTNQVFHIARSNDLRAREATRAAVSATRSARGRAGVATALAAGGTALAARQHRAKATPISYR